jgi:hypothetical protein
MTDSFPVLGALEGEQACGTPAGGSPVAFAARWCSTLSLLLTVAPIVTRKSPEAIALLGLPVAGVNLLIDSLRTARDVR